MLEDVPRPANHTPTGGQDGDSDAYRSRNIVEPLSCAETQAGEALLGTTRDGRSYRYGCPCRKLKLEHIGGVARPKVAPELRGLRSGRHAR